MKLNDVVPSILSRNDLNELDLDSLMHDFITYNKSRAILMQLFGALLEKKMKKS